MLSRDQSIIRLGKIPLKHIMIMSWHPFHLILTILVTIVLIFTYLPPKAMDEKFWYPLYEQTHDISSSFRSFWSPRKSKLKKSTREDNSENMNDHPLATENLELKEEMGTNRPIDGNRECSTSICSVGNDCAVKSNISAISKQEWNKKRENYNRKITSTFFFVSFIFIVLAIPTTTTVIILLAYCRWIEFHLNLFYGAIFCQTLFSLVFLINPIFYMRINQIVVQKINCLVLKKGTKTENTKVDKM